MPANACRPPMILNRPPVGTGPPAMMALAGAPPHMMMSTVPPSVQQSSQVNNRKHNILIIIKVFLTLENTCGNVYIIPNLLIDLF